MMTTVPSNPSNNVTPLRILNKGPEYFRNSKLRLSGSEHRRKTAAERLEADKCKYVKSEEVRQRRFTLELRTGSPPNNDGTGAHSLGTASTESPVNMEEDYDITAGNDIEFPSDRVVHAMANFSKVKPTVNSQISNKAQNERLNNKTSPTGSNAEIQHTIAANRRQLRMKNMAQRGSEREALQKSETNLPPSPLVSRLRERLQSNGSSHSNSTTTTGYASSPSPTGGVSAENSPQSPPETKFAGFTHSNTNHLSKGNSASSNYLKKAKEGIKNVASLRAIIGLDKNSGSRERQSRAIAPTTGRRYRSASAGPNIVRSVQGRENKYQSKLTATRSDASESKRPVMSPRTQLKHVRQNLKKVQLGNSAGNSDQMSKRHHSVSENTSVNVPSETKYFGGRSFTVEPSKSKLEEVVEDQDSRFAKETKIETKPPVKPRLKSEKENIERTASADFQPKYFEVLKKRSSSSTSSKEDNEDASNTEATQDSQKSIEIKRRSWDVLQSSENFPSTATSKSFADELPNHSTNAMETDTTQQTHGSSKQRRPRSYQSDQRKNSQLRLSLPEDSLQSKDGQLYTKIGSRKSVAEAIEEIINPVLHDDSSNTKNNPQENEDENTLVGNRESFYGNWSVAATYNTGAASSSSKNAHRLSSIADNINIVLGGSVSENKSDSSDSKNNNNGSNKSSPSNSRSKVSDTEKLKRIEASSTELLDSSGQATKSSSKGPSFFDGPNNASHLRHVPMRQHSAPSGTVNSRPTSRIDMPPQSFMGNDGGKMFDSPVLPSKAKNGSSPKNNNRSPGTKMEDTLKSQTSSSGSGDPHKPFTALTANDLKPRLTNVVSAPLKPMFAYPGQPVSQSRHNPKRHTTTPVSPTLSPNKQQARMTPPLTPTRSSSSTPYSSLKRTPTSSRSSSLKRNRNRGSKPDIHHQSELDRFFSTMGMEDYRTITSVNDTIYSNHWSSESDFSFAGASAYVRDSPDEAMEIDPNPVQLIRGPQSVSIIEKNARVMRWLMSCQKNRKLSSSSRPTPRDEESKKAQTPITTSSAREPVKPSHNLIPTFPSSPAQPGRKNVDVVLTSNTYNSSPPPIPPRTYQRQRPIHTGQDDVFVVGPKESNV